MTDAYVDLDGTAMAEAVARGEVSPAELAAEATSRIGQLEHLNIVVHRFDPDEALQDLPQDGPFRGVPFLFKDDLEIAGRPLTMGSRLLKDYLPPDTHPVAERMLKAGFVALGRTNMSELGLVPLTEPAAYGATHNPWKHGYSPGGSSGGSAAAVAAGIVPIAQASDGGGSIRIPASACGLVGLKPSRGRNPCSRMDPPQGFVSYLAVTRTVRDAARMLDVTSGALGRFALPPPAQPYVSRIERDPTPRDIAFTSRGFFGERLHPDVETAIRATADVLSDAGHRIVEVDPPVASEPFGEAFGALWCAGAGVFFKSAQREAPLPGWLQAITRRPWVFRMLMSLPVMDGGAPVEAFTRRLAALDSGLNPSDLWLAEQALDDTADELRAFFGEHDLWLSATLPQPPAAIGTLTPTGPREALVDRLFRYVGHLPVANATGLPAISIPTGKLAGGLPVGAHVLAPMGREDWLLEIAGQLERIAPWPTLSPLALGDRASDQ
ncbi:MAG: amidase [Myxococcales bacterium]|nr:amidase [Myxococcales bacterium]